MTDLTKNKEAAREYMKKSGFGLVESEKMMKAYSGLRGCTLGTNGPSGHTEVTIDDQMADRCEFILKGIRAIRRENRAR